MAKEPEIVDAGIAEVEIVEDETEGEEDTEPTVSITGFNLSAVVTPVECSECGEEFYIKPDTIESANFCPSCGAEFIAYRTEF